MVRRIHFASAPLTSRHPAYAPLSPSLPLSLSPSRPSPPLYRLSTSDRAQVPGTVLTSLVLNDDVPDPNIGLNSLEVPDIGDTGPEVYTHSRTHTHTHTRARTHTHLQTHFGSVEKHEYLNP
jgi:hypothetical protein